MVALWILALFLSGTNAALQFATYYQDHMVLQRGPQQAVVWGHASKIGDTVKVTVSGHGSVSGSTSKDSAGNGMWKLKLPAITEKGPFTVTATSSEGTVTIKDVLFGDVWLCGGQSNMEFTMSTVMNHTAEVQHSLQFTDIRIMKVQHAQSAQPQSELGSKGIATAWTKPTVQAVAYFSAVCWLFGEYLHPDVNYPIGLIESNWGGTPIESWSSSDALAKCPQHMTKRGPFGRSILWNPMINPLLGLTIYGAIWYQGESNAGRPDLYKCQFPEMITDWRNKFHDASLGETSKQFPFGFVQLAGYRNTTGVGGMPGLRWSQTADLGQVPNKIMPNVFMSVAMDLPDYNSPRGSIHPRYKQDVARRLELAARAVAYKDSTVKYQGPFPRTITENKPHHSLHIVYHYGPIVVNNNDGFEVCCSASANTKCTAHSHWVKAPITSHQSTDVVITTAGCKGQHVMGVRYAWRESPCDYKQCAIYGKDTSLPAPIFVHYGGFGAGATIIGR